MPTQKATTIPKPPHAAKLPEKKPVPVKTETRLKEASRKAGSSA